MVRDDERIRAGVCSEACIALIQYSFDDELAAPAFFDPFDITPIQARIKLLGSPRRQGRHIAYASSVTHNIAKGSALRHSHAKTPTGLGHHINNVGNG